MNFPRYPEYKPSGVEWLGEVPAHWGLKRLKFAAACINDKQDVLPEGLEYVAMEHIESWTGKRLETENGVTPESQTSRFRRGDVLFGKLRPYLAKVWLADRDGVCSTELLVLRERDLEPAYLRYWTLMRSFVEVVDGSTYGSKMPRASWDFIGNVLSLIPERDEQRAIAAFLDRETARIDALIAKKQQLIELLAEKRTALISQAVTRGLNPDAPMKDSGVEWLGEIPAHWKVSKFGRVAFFQEGPGLRNWQFTDSGVRVICVTNITDTGINFSNYEKFISETEYSDSYQHFTVQKGDLLLSSSGNSWGKVAEFVADQTAILNTSTIRINENSVASSKRPFLKWLLQSNGVREQLGLFMTGACQPNFGPSHLSRVLVAVPTAEDQLSIASFLEDKVHAYDRLVQEIESAIEQLKEYRAATISAAVTGKIDVRSFVKEREVA